MKLRILLLQTRPSKFILPVFRYHKNVYPHITWHHRILTILYWLQLFLKFCMVPYV